MNNLIHHQATRDVLKSRFGSHKRLRCKTTLQYPVSVEREYQRITNAYTKLLNDTLKRHLPEIRAAASMEEATRHDDIGDLVSIVQQAFLDMGVELDNSTHQSSDFLGKHLTVALEEMSCLNMGGSFWTTPVWVLQDQLPAIPDL